MYVIHSKELQEELHHFGALLSPDVANAQLEEAILVRGFDSLEEWFQSKDDPVAARRRSDGFFKFRRRELVREMSDCFAGPEDVERFALAMVDGANGKEISKVDLIRAKVLAAVQLCQLEECLLEEHNDEILSEYMVVSRLDHAINQLLVVEPATH